MTNCWNSDEFQGALTGVFRASERVRAVLEQVAPKATKESERKAVEERVKFWLECHARDFCIDHLLAALNWQLRPMLDAQDYVNANLVSEQSPDAGGGVRVREETPERTKRMDYLGYDRNTDDPLMVVEAKRPSIDLPGETPSLAAPDAHDSGRLIADALEALRLRKDIPKKLLTKEWQEALGQLRGYCRTVKSTRGAWPKRAVLTTGEWLVLFANPENAFGEQAGDEVRPHEILVFESRERTLQHYKLLWTYLEYSSLAGLDRRLLVPQVAYAVDPAMLEKCSFGLRVSYTVKSTNYRRAPLLSVSPVLFVRGRGGAFIQVGADVEREIPIDEDGSIADHIAEVRTASQRLKQQLEERVLGGRALELASIQTHCADREALRLRPLVQPLSHEDGESFLLLTGENAHFVLEGDDYAGCPYHRFAEARTSGVAQEAGPLLESELDPKSYFADGSRHHCTHNEVFVIKREAVTEANSARCGHRAAAVGSAFCEVWRFEEFLCCRSCAFLSVCSQARAYSLPCRDPVPLTINGNPPAVAAAH